MQYIELLYLIPAGIAVYMLYRMIMMRNKKEREADTVWREFARIKELKEHKPTKGSVLAFQGQNQSFPFVLECQVTQGRVNGSEKVPMRRGKELHYFTKMKLLLSGLPKGLRIYKETGLSRMGKAIGMQDILSGDSIFDDTFMIKGDDQQEVLNYLNQSRRTVFIGFSDKLEGLELREEGLLLIQEGQIESIEKLGLYFSQLGALALSLART